MLRVAGKRRTRRHDEDPPGHGPKPRGHSSQELTGPRRTDSPQAGVERLAQVAGNEAVAGMLQRVGDDEELVEDGGGGADSFEAPEQQVEEPPAQQGGDDFVIADNVDGGGNDFVIGDDIEGAQQDGPQEAEFQSREERVQNAQDVAEADGPVPQGGGGGGIFAEDLRALAQNRLKGADAKTISLADGLANAVGAAWSSWQSTASVVGVSINAVTASGGQLIGAPLQPLIAANGGGVDAEILSAVAQAVGNAHLTFTNSFSLGGLPLFPSFAAVPAPVAPPTPAIPTGLLAAGMSSIAFNGLSRAVSVRDKRKQQAVAAVLEALEQAVQSWLARTIMSFLGTGPVPTFAPPYVPVGPVVGGIGTGLPGSLN